MRWSAESGNMKATGSIKSLKSLLLLLAITILVNIAGSYLFARFDLTSEKRYTLTPATKQMLRNIEGKITVEVYLEGDDLPAGMKKLRNSTRDLLQELRVASNGKLEYSFVNLNDLRSADAKEDRQKALVKLGVLPINLEVNNDGGYSEKLIFPGAVLKYEGREVGVNILENQKISGAQNALDNSDSFLEYKLANAIHKLQMKSMPNVAFLQGHGEVNVSQVSDFLQTLVAQNFNIGKIEPGIDPLLNGKTDVLIVAKPQTAFSEDDKVLVDQFLLHGGRVLWLVDQAVADMDSFKLSPYIFAIPRDLNIDDQLFRYGVRINNDMLLDLYCNPQPIVEEIAGNPQPKLYPWVFYPIIRTSAIHPIVKNLDPIALKFASSIDTIRSPGVKKTILLSSSQYTRRQGVPFQIFLEGAKQQPSPALFNLKDVPVAVLLEGEFTSPFRNRLTMEQNVLLAKERQTFLPNGRSRMIVVGDGDVVVNEIDPNGAPLPLGYYRATRETFANKEFLLNCVEYLLDDNGLIEARNRETKMRLLDKALVNDQKSLWQFINIALPLLLLGVYGLIFNAARKRKYTKAA